MQTRENALHQWLKSLYPDSPYHLTPLAGDASFRRYYRLQQEAITKIVMDAPPTKIALAPFVAVAELLNQQGVTTPEIHAIDYTNGFALLEDFGNVLFRDALGTTTSDHLYQSAISILGQMQQHVVPTKLEAFDEAFMLQELALFHDWFLHQYLGLTLSRSEQKLLQQTFSLLTAHIAKQPQVLIHRDYHSRNIMLLDALRPSTAPKFGIIDFQDAMIGPLTYDLVSLLKDCYIQLPQDQILKWLRYFYDYSTFTKSCSFDEIQQAFDWCGLQRHLKVLGVFSRLHLRDGKSNYLADLPLTFHYVQSCLETYEVFQTFGQWFKERVQAPFMDTLK